MDASPAKAPHMTGKPMPAIQKMIPNKIACYDAHSENTVHVRHDRVVGSVARIRLVTEVSSGSIAVNCDSQPFPYTSST